MLVDIVCGHCGAASRREAGGVNRSRRNGNNIYCSQRCSGLARRSSQTAADRKEAKRLYDIEYRAKNRKRLKKVKADYFQRTYDKDEATIARRKRNADKPEIEEKRRKYMRSDKYKRQKSEYDRTYRANKTYGEGWGECFLLLVDVEKECLSRASRYEISKAAGTLCKSQNRKREYVRLNSREPKECPVGDIEQP